MKRLPHMKNPMRSIRAALVAGLVAVSTGCKDFLDVNNNPNGPETVSANLYVPPMLHWMATSQPFDGRFVGRYVQNFTFVTTSLTTWDRMGYDPGSDNAGEVWRTVYWIHGQNLLDMNRKAEAEQRWDLLGLGMILKGWGWMTLASLHGDIIVRQAFDQTRFAFDYDTEQYALDEAKKMLDSAIVLLRRTDGAVDATYLGKTDRVYNGDRNKWRKFAFGLRAMLQNRYSNKASYSAAAVINDVDSSFVSNADDALFAYPAAQPGDDRNFWGTARQNITSYRQTRFALELMNGTQFGGTVDPRMTRMLAPASDGAYRGYDINTVNKTTAFPAAQQPYNFWGYTTVMPAGSPSRYIFSDKTKFPIMTYSQLQFVKAEAAFRANNRTLALTAYTNGISSHIDFVNARNQDDGQTATQISAAEKAAYLASPNIVPAAATLTMTQIMSQKYIAQWMWGFFEQWMDMRRFHYTDTYPGEAQQVFPGFAPPTTLDVNNQGKLVYRLRPRFNSEYVWNLDGLSKITPVAGTAGDYQTSQLWIINP